MSETRETYPAGEPIEPMGLARAVSQIEEHNRQLAGIDASSTGPELPTIRQSTFAKGEFQFRLRVYPSGRFVASILEWDGTLQVEAEARSEVEAWGLCVMKFIEAQKGAGG
jgi:hypothetical protein